MLLTQKLPDPRAGNVASQGVTLHQSSTLDPRSANRVSVTGLLTTLGGGVPHEKDLKTSSEEGMVANCSRVLRNPGRSRGPGGQMHKKQHQRGFLFCSQPARGRTREAGAWSSDGPGHVSGGWVRRVHTAHQSWNTALDPQGQGAVRVVRGTASRWPSQGHREERGCQVRGSFQSVGRTVSQRRAVDTWVVEGTEVLVSTVALFGEVSADGAAGFVCEQAKIGQLKM